jgi:hypothetical protein
MTIQELTMADYNNKIAQLKKEVEELENEKEFTNSQEKLDFLDNEIYDTKDSIEKLKQYV